MSRTLSIISHRARAQAYYIKQQPLQYFCRHSTYQFVPHTYYKKIVRTRNILGVKSLYFVCTSTYSYKSNSHFIWNPNEVYSLYIPCIFHVRVGSLYILYYMVYTMYMPSKSKFYFYVFLAVSNFQCSKPLPLRAIKCRRQNFSTQHDSQWK